MRQIINGVITGTMFGYEDHGILTCMIYTDHEHGSQGFGGYSMDRWVEPLKMRVGTKYGMDFVIAILKTVGVEKWEALKGKHVRLDCDYSKIYRIGHIINDKWFDPAELKEPTE